MRLSPPELSYLYTSLTSTPPLRPDLRTVTQYRPYSIETDFLSTANGSARVTWGSGREGGDVLVVVKAQIDNAVELAKDVYGGQVSIDMYSSAAYDINLSDGDEDSRPILVESLSSLLCPQHFSAYGIDPRSLVITDTKAWHVYIDCVVRDRCVL
jgi:exosome complex component RRP42